MHLQNTVKTQPPPKGNYEPFFDVILSVTKTNRMVYEKCVSSKQTSPSKTQNKWLTDCQIILIPLTGKWYTNSPLVAQKYQN